MTTLAAVLDTLDAWSVYEVNELNRDLEAAGWTGHRFDGRRGSEIRRAIEDSGGFFNGDSKARYVAGYAVSSTVAFGLTGTASTKNGRGSSHYENQNIVRRYEQENPS